MRSRFWLVLMALGPATALAWGDECKFHADRAAGVVQGHRKRLVPAQLGLGLACPEPLVVGGGFGAQRGNILGLEAGSGGEFFRRRKLPFLDEDGLYVLVIHGRGV